MSSSVENDSENNSSWVGLPPISGPEELRNLIEHLVELDAPDLCFNKKFIDNITQEQIRKYGIVGDGLVELVRKRIREVPSPNGSKRFLLRSDFNDSFLAFQIAPIDKDLGCHFFGMLQILTEKVLHDRHVFTEHWGELKSDLYIRTLQAAKKFDPTKGTPYTFFYRVIYRRTITLHERMLRDRGRYVCYPYEQKDSPFSATMAGPDEMLNIRQETERLIGEDSALLKKLCPSKIETTRILFRNLFCWSRRPDDERRKFVKRNLPAYLDLMKENKMTRGEVNSLISLFPAEDVAMADLGVKIENFPIISEIDEVKNIDQMAPTSMLRKPEPWAEEALSVIKAEIKISEIVLADKIKIGRIRLRKEIERLCKMRGIVLHRDKQGDDYIYHLGVTL